MLVRLDLQGSPFLGVYARASEAHVIVPTSAPDKFPEEAGKALEADPIATTIGGSTVIGTLMAINSQGAVVSDILQPHEHDALDQAGLRVTLLPPPLNAAGNVVLANDHGAVVHPHLGTKARERVERALGVPVIPTTVAGLRTPGSVAVCNNKGALIHPKATDEETALIEEALGVPVRPCTVNHGSPYVGAGLVANTKGALIGGNTTGPELSRIEDGLGYLD